MNSRTIIHNVRFAGDTAPDRWVAINGQRIEKVGYGPLPESELYEAIDGGGALLMPGVIDCHVHFRQPGLTHKADIASESRAALAGGVTSYCDMPNTKPPTTSIEAWMQKCEIASRQSLANYAFFIGATNDNLDQLMLADYSRIPGIKLFMGSSTGNMLVDDETAISEIFSHTSAIVAVHAEDQDIISANTAAARLMHPEAVPLRLHSQIRSAEACFKSTAKAVDLARKWRHRLHLCHISTARELQLLSDGPLKHKLVTAEVSPHHLMWCDDDYARQGARIKMNPAVKTAADRHALRLALASGLIDMVATDHAPHLPADKEGDALSAASGAPILQFSLPIMLGMFPEETVVKTMCANPAEIFHIQHRGEIKPGYFADLALVVNTDPYEITDEMALSKCGWTPAAGYKVSHRVAKTWVNGHLAYDNGAFSPQKAAQPLLFER